MTTILLASRMPAHDRIAHDVRAAGHDVIQVATPQELEAGDWKSRQPEFLFFTHWSHRIPREIHEAWPCIIFHMADLPAGRGGSPVQNLIVLGHESTSLCALKCVEEMDAGPVYLRRPISLEGTVSEILARATTLMAPMILEIINRRPEPTAQSGVASTFRRRKPADGNLSGVDGANKVYDHIRMLDGEGYPAAFLETQTMVFEFSGAHLRDGDVVANVRIRRKTT